MSERSKVIPRKVCWTIVHDKQGILERNFWWTLDEKSLFLTKIFVLPEKKKFVIINFQTHIIDHKWKVWRENKSKSNFPRKLFLSVTGSHFFQWKHRDVILNRSNNCVFLCLKIYWNRQVFDLISSSGIWMKPKTLHYQVSSSKFWMQYLKVLIWD